MEKNNGKPFMLQILRGMDITVSMMTFICLCHKFKDYLPEAEKVGAAQEEFDKSLLAALDGDKVISSAVRKKGNAFLDELERFQTLPPAKDKDIKKLIGDMKKATHEVLRVG